MSNHLERSGACPRTPPNSPNSSPIRRTNVVGRTLARLRYQRGWCQEELATRLQKTGCLMTRNVVANVETFRSPVTDEMLIAYIQVYQVDIRELFPPQLLTLTGEAPVLGLPRAPHERRRRRRRRRGIQASRSRIHQNRKCAMMKT